MSTNTNNYFTSLTKSFSGFITDQIHQFKQNMEKYFSRKATYLTIVIASLTVLLICLSFLFTMPATATWSDKVGYFSGIVIAGIAILVTVAIFFYQENQKAKNKPNLIADFDKKYGGLFIQNIGSNPAEIETIFVKGENSGIKFFASSDITTPLEPNQRAILPLYQDELSSIVIIYKGFDARKYQALAFNYYKNEPTLNIGADHNGYTHKSSPIKYQNYGDFTNLVKKLKVNNKSLEALKNELTRI